MELRGYKRTHHHHGIPLHVEVSPCSWAYPHYGLQISVRMPDEHCAYLSKRIDFETATRKDIEDLVSTISFQKCNKCDSTTFNPTTVKTNRSGLCNSCFTAESNLRFAEELAKEQEMETSMRREGYTHKTIMWVHPSSGNDRQVILYTKGDPKPSDVKAELKKLGSLVLDDYVTHKMK